MELHVWASRILNPLGGWSTLSTPILSLSLIHPLALSFFCYPNTSKRNDQIIHFGQHLSSDVAVSGTDWIHSELDQRASWASCVARPTEGAAASAAVQFCWWALFTHTTNWVAVSSNPVTDYLWHEEINSNKRIHNLPPSTRMHVFKHLQTRSPFFLVPTRQDDTHISFGPHNTDLT